VAKRQKTGTQPFVSEWDLTQNRSDRISSFVAWFRRIWKVSEYRWYFSWLKL